MDELWKEEGLTKLEALMDWMEKNRARLFEEMPAGEVLTLKSCLDDFYSDLGFNKSPR